MGNDTKVTHVAIAGAAATIIVGTMKYFAADFVNAVPGLNEAMVVLITAGLAYIKKA